MLLTYNGTNFDTMLGSSAILSSAVTLTTAGITSSGVTAPNLTNSISGCWIWIKTLPSSGNFTIEIMESGIAKALATINFADINLGANYVRFATPYQFTTLTANAYTVRAKNTVANTGQIANATTNLWFEFTYDATVATPTSTDNVWCAGFNDAGLTPKLHTLSGTANAWGTGAATALGSVSQTMGAAVTVGSGGTMKYDQTASTTLSIKGSIFTTKGGLFDMRPPAGNKAIVSTLIINGVANGDQGIFTATTGGGGQILTRGATYDVYTKFASGLGTVVSPLITGIAWDADVGDEIIIGGGTDYLKNELRYIKTRNSSTSFVLSATSGGVESALVNTHAVGAHIGNLTRNSIIKPLVNNIGWYSNNNSSTAISEFDYTRMEYSDCSSGKSLSLNPTSLSTYDGVVLYHTSISGRSSLLVRPGADVQTHTGVILYNTQGTNFSGQSGIAFSTSSSKTFVDCFQFNAPSSILSCGFISLNVSSTANTFTNCHSYGGNAVNSTAGYAIGLFSSSANIFNDCSVNGARQNAVYGAVGNNIFNNCDFGTMGNNNVDITCLTGTLNQMLFNSCSFGSTTIITNYLNQLDTSLISFQDMDGDQSKHRWYTNYGSWWSSGVGLTDTTVRTVGSLALVSKPENNSIGSSWTFKVPANPASQVGIFGYVYRNALFSAGTLKVELFLPGTLLTATPDAIYTFPVTTGQWLPFNIATYYSGLVARYATVRITGVTSTVGAYFFVDDLYDAGTGNKVAGLDLWDQGLPSPVIVASDFSAIPAQVWGYADTNTQAGTMGKRQIDASKVKLLL